MFKTWFSPTDENKGVQFSVFNVGIIAMEFLSGFETIAFQIHSDRHYADYYEKNPLKTKPQSLSYIPRNEDIYKYWKALAIFELDRLYRIGYVYNDYHEDNFMVNAFYFYAGKPGRVIIIDMGDVFRVDTPPYSSHAVTSEDILSSLNFILNYERPASVVNGKRIKSTVLTIFPQYAWLIIQPEKREYYKALLDEIIVGREQTKQGFIEHQRQIAGESALVAQRIEGKIGGAIVVDQRNEPSREFIKPDFNEHKFSQSPIINNYNQKTLNKLRVEPISNVFNKLDPNNLFTPTYVDNYIKQEKTSSSELLRNFLLRNKKKGGRTHRKRNNRILKGRTKRNVKRRTRRTYRRKIK